MNKASITKNYINNLLYQMLFIIAPLITTPYLSRILSINDIGRYSYSRSITTYFILLGTLGINFYAQREIAVLQGDSKKQREFFWEVFFLRIFTVSISVIIFSYFYIIGKTDATLNILLSIEIISAVFDISWYFQGQERFSDILCYNAIIKVLSICSIFIFVKNQTDLLVYAFIYSATVFMNNICLWILLPQNHFLGMFRKLHFKRHIIPSLSLFIPQAAIQIYTVLDKTMIGIITKSELQNAYYEQCYKIITIILMLVTSLGVVLLSRVAKLNFDNNYALVKRYINISLKFSLFLAIPMSVGLICISKEILELFLGEQYAEADNILKILSMIIVFIAISNVIGIQYLIALRRQREYTISVIVGALVNIVANLVLIKGFGAFGAAIATVISECMVMITQLYFVRNEFLIKQMFRYLWKYLLASGVMVVMLLLIDNINCDSNSYMMILLKVAIGAGSYYLVLYSLNDELAKILFTKVRDLIKNRKFFGGI